LLLKDQLPTIITTNDVTSNPRALNIVPALIADLGDEAAWRYVATSGWALTNDSRRLGDMRVWLDEERR
jgi:hypothetical protein